jgi:hypothetical protein
MLVPSSPENENVPLTIVTSGESVIGAAFPQVTVVTVLPTTVKLNVEGSVSKGKPSQVALKSKELAGT